MTYKSYNPDSLLFFDRFGMRISPLGEVFNKAKLGWFLGGLNLITVIFGVYSVKYINIPL